LERKQQATKETLARFAREEEYSQCYKALRDEILLMEGHQCNEQFHGRTYDVAAHLPRLAELLVQYFQVLQGPEYLARLESVGERATLEHDKHDDNSRLALVCLRYALGLIRTGIAGASKEQVERKLNEVNAHPQMASVWKWLIRLGYEVGPEYGVPAAIPEQPTTAGKPIEPKPHWDKLARELVYDGCLLRHYRDPAEAQITILDTFEELSWPKVVDSPFPNTPTGKDQLNNAIKNLNAGLKQKDLIEFCADGTGIHVCWRKL
jgi:hypothetical protein